MADPKGGDPDYRTDTFSRNDREGLPAHPTQDELDGLSGAESVPVDPHKAEDDADSRDATPPPVREGGVP